MKHESSSQKCPDRVPEPINNEEGGLLGQESGHKL